LEKFICTLADEGITLFDRWVITKSAYKPARGNRALTNFEFVLLFSNRPNSLVLRKEVTTSFSGISFSGNIGGNLGTTPYYSDIPRQVFSAYGFDKVLDPFCGTGTSLKVASELGLEWVGCELRQDICDYISPTLPQHERLFL
jgi:hypothetical protein